MIFRVRLQIAQADTRGLHAEPFEGPARRFAAIRQRRAVLNDTRRRLVLGVHHRFHDRARRCLTRRGHARDHGPHRQRLERFRHGRQRFGRPVSRDHTKRVFLVRLKTTNRHFDGFFKITRRAARWFRRSQPSHAFAPRLLIKEIIGARFAHREGIQLAMQHRATRRNPRRFSHDRCFQRQRRGR